MCLHCMYISQLFLVLVSNTPTFKYYQVYARTRLGTYDDDYWITSFVLASNFNVHTYMLSVALNAPELLEHCNDNCCVYGCCWTWP